MAKKKKKIAFKESFTDQMCMYLIVWWNVLWMQHKISASRVFSNERL